MTRPLVDDIAVYRAVNGDPVWLSAPERAEAVRRMNAAGAHDSVIAGTLRLTVRTVLRIRARHNLGPACGKTWCCCGRHANTTSRGAA